MKQASDHQLVVPALAARRAGRPLIGVVLGRRLLAAAVVALGLLSSPAAVRAQTPPADCSADQCECLRLAKRVCGRDVPFVCLPTGGCDSDSSRLAAGCAQAPPSTGCGQGVCDTSKCTFLPADQRASRTITFVNQCQTKLSVFRTDGGAGATHQHAFDIDPGGATFDLQVALVQDTNSEGNTYFRTSNGDGINFRAQPDDGDMANTTLFEINFGADRGNADFYNLSAIPPLSCAAHLRQVDQDGQPVANFGYADHLPIKDPNNPAQSWACLPQPGTTKPDPSTCGDGLGASLCPAVTNAGTTLTDTPPTAKNDPDPTKIVYGCGVPGETCAAGVTACCPQVCAARPGEDARNPKVRNRVRDCAFRQGTSVFATQHSQHNPARGTGFWKGMAVEPVWRPGQQQSADCQSRTCSAGTEAKPDFSDMGSTCTGYLWPYDDAVALVQCPATPDYRVTFCPAG